MQTQTAKLTISSSVFRDGQTIPMSAVFDDYGCTGQNQSPDLSWSGAPPNTKSYAITIWDPDAPTGVGFVHWVLFNIPGNVTSLKAGAGSHTHAQVGATQGFTDYGFSKYGGPCPPPGDSPHHYHLTVYALDIERFEGLDETTTYAKFRFMARSHTLASGEIVALFGRPAE
ncbi:MAG TPA: YbhB/YbcL family Raf kinase inhibitor-like protein [Candidatus Baltobacteraceae bacterium]|nr:YbhB/YbcL family Raf kinase inhibitor-like protein [Candidatus Baltobacteraceae bacterium]